MSYLPTRGEIRDKATEIFMEDRVKKGLPPITPEEDELREGSYWERARDQLMRERTAALDAERSYLEQMASELGLKIVPAQVAERVEALKDTMEKLREEQRRRREAEKALKEAEEKKAEPPEVYELRRRLTEAELTVKEYEKKLEAYPGPAPPIIAPPPTPKVAPPPPFVLPPRPVLEERPISRECWSLYKRMWDAINNQRAIESSTKVLSGRTGMGVSLIAEAVAYARMGNARKIEDYVNRLLECECLKEERGK